MLDQTSQAQLNALIDAFEREGGFVPWVTPVATLYTNYRLWTVRKGRSTTDIATFVFDLVHRQACAPCRLPDGTLGMLGVKPKGDFN